MISSRMRLFLGAVLAIAGLLAMRSALGGAFIFDDYSLLALPRFFDNPLLPFWHEHVEGGLHYRPLGLTFWWFSQHLFGANPLPHYLLNAGLLAASVIALWRLLTRISGSEMLAFVIALGFAVHPVAIGTAAWLSNRFELLAAIFGLLALGQAWQFRLTRNRSSLVASLSLFAIALCAKENAVALISAAFIFWWWPVSSPIAWFRRDQWACLWLVALIVLWLLVREVVLDSRGAEILFNYKSAAALFKDGMTAWTIKLASYASLVPRLGWTTGVMFLLGVVGVLGLIVQSLRSCWSTHRVAALLAGLSVIAVAAIVQWPRTGLVLMNLNFGADAFMDVLAARYYFMAAVGFAIVLAVLLVRPALAGSRRRSAWLPALVALLVCIPLFSVSQHIVRSYRGQTIAQNEMANAAVDAIAKLDLPVANCQIHLLGTQNLQFGFYADPAVKALSADLSRVANCYVQTENAPWYYLVNASEVARSKQPPFTPARLGEDAILPILLGRGALVFVNLPPDARPDLGPGSFFLEWKDNAFVDIGDAVRSGQRKVEFACFRPASQCP
ncbi:hypothetical protein [Dokdonella sp.]|uniref:hypothetical protein n=1 Tax=Dokdonella sp. TaxID=2291710 RepID=UPI003C5B48BD